jgi:hypothetical protein
MVNYTIKLTKIFQIYCTFYVTSVQIRDKPGYQIVLGFLSTSPCTSVQAAVLYGFGNVFTAYGIGCIHVGNGA